MTANDCQIKWKNLKIAYNNERALRAKKEKQGSSRGNNGPKERKREPFKFWNELNDLLQDLDTTTLRFVQESGPDARNVILVLFIEKGPFLFTFFCIGHL